MWIDIGLIIIIGGCIVWGFIRGGIREIFGILAIIIGIVGASRFYSKFAKLLPISSLPIAKAVSFIIIFVGIALFIVLIGFLVHKLIHFVGLGCLNRILGLVLGAIKGSLLAGIICFFITLFPQGDKVLQKSKVAPMVLRELRILRVLFPKELQQKLRWRTPREPVKGRHL